MARRKAPEELSVEELRRLLVQRRGGARQARLEAFRRTGRIVGGATPPAGESGDGEPTQGAAGEAISAPQPARRRVLDRLLLGIEILAVLGLIGILASGLGLLRDLNREVAAALRPESPTPTPLVTAVVLPSGHTPPDASGTTRPNDAEIPEHLRPVFQSLANVPIPTASPGQAMRIQIPSLRIDAPVVQGDGWEQLKKGVGQHIGSANPGDDGNVVLSAHNDVYGELFRYLDRLAPGDEVILYTQQRQYTYIVDRTLIVEPTDVEVMSSTGSPTVTLISCYPYLVDKQRIVVFAKFQN